MLDARSVVDSLEAARRAGASRDELLQEAVRLIEGSEERYDWVGIYLLEEPGDGETGGEGGGIGGDVGGPGGVEAGAGTGPDGDGGARDARAASSPARPAAAGPARGVLVLHTYIGRPTDHTRIPVGRGVCGTAVAEGRDINVPDVHAVENYLACSVETASELVVLIRDPETGEIRGQIDLDSDRPAAFTERDEEELRAVADWLGGLLA